MSEQRKLLKHFEQFLTLFYDQYISAVYEQMNKTVPGSKPKVRIKDIDDLADVNMLSYEVYREGRHYFKHHLDECTDTQPVAINLTDRGLFLKWQFVVKKKGEGYELSAYCHLNAPPRSLDKPVNKALEKIKKALNKKGFHFE
jgi:hypothetical protein